MTRVSVYATARNLRAVFILGCSLASAIAIAAGTGNTSSPAPAAATEAQSSKVPASKPQAPVKPLWVELTPAQRQALSPLAVEWDKLDSFRKKKWLAIGNKYASMKPEEQQRVQDRMRDWVRLTPEQRRVARENYARAKKLDRDQKSAHWQQYQQLPEEQKKKLAEASASKKHVATLPSPAHNKGNKTIPPIKSAPKPVIEQSVTPQAAGQSALQSSAPQPSK